MVSILSQMNVSGGVVTLQGCPTAANESLPKHYFDCSGLTLRQALDRITTDDHSYKWTWDNGSVAANDTIQLIAAEWGGGVVVRDQSTQGTQQTVRFDGQGNMTSLNATGLTPDFSPIFGIWYGYNNASYQQVEMAQIVPSELSFCPIPRCHHFHLDDMPNRIL